MNPIDYIIYEITNTLLHIQESTPKFDNPYRINFNKDLATFVITIKGKLDKDLKYGIHKKFSNLMLYKGIVFNYVFVYNKEQ